MTTTILRTKNAMPLWYIDEHLLRAQILLAEGRIQEARAVIAHCRELIKQEEKAS